MLANIVPALLAREPARNRISTAVCWGDISSHGSKQESILDVL